MLGPAGFLQHLTREALEERRLRSRAQCKASAWHTLGPTRNLASKVETLAQEQASCYWLWTDSGQRSGPRRWWHAEL